MKKGIYRVFTVPIYGVEVLVSFGLSVDALKKVLAKKGVSEKDINYFFEGLKDSVTARVVDFKRNQYVIWYKENENSYEMMSTIAHESFHLATLILDNIGVKLDIETTDEVYAYLLGYIVKKNVEILNINKKQ